MFETNILLKNQNKCIFIVFIGSAILFILMFYWKLSVVLGNIAMILGILGVSVKSLLNEKEVFSIVAENNKGLNGIDRSNDYKDIVSKKGIVLLTAETGAGKSCLLEQLFEAENNHCKIYRQNRDFYINNLDKMRNCQYIILDQFERAVSMGVASKIISQLRLLSDKYIVISIRSEYVMSVYRLLKKYKMETSLYYLDNHNIKSEVIKYLERYFGRSEEKFSENELAAQILKDVYDENISLIQIDNICQRIGTNFISLYELRDKWIEANKEYDELIANLWMEEIEKTKYEKVIYEILYFLSLDWKYQYKYTFADIQNITFLPKERLSNILNYLENKKWIAKLSDLKERTGNTEEKINSIDDEYAFSHDYYLEKFQKIAMGRIDEQVRKNIDYYHLYCQEIRKASGKKEREGISNKETGYKDSKSYTIYKRCKDFFDRYEKKYNYIDTILFIFLIVYLALNFINMNNLSANNTGGGMEEHIKLALLNFAIGGSVMYAYNYYYYFLSFKKVFIFMPLIGVSLCTIICSMPDLWGILLGIEVFSVGVAVFGVQCYCRIEEKPYFRQKGIMFSIIGIVIIAGGVFLLYQGIDSYYFLDFMIIFYILYITLGIRNHINRNNLKALLGKAIYNGRLNN